MLRRIVRIAGIVLAWLAGLVGMVALAGFITLRSSLPRLEGEITVPGLAAPVSVTRDSLGVPDLTASSRLDAARALGYLHGQDRFFQMDLQRRSAAGELAGLLGSALIDADRDSRRHRFRVQARKVIDSLDRPTRRLLEAYADGVNFGLSDLKAPPFEYLLLREKPQPWLAEDSVLTLDSMFLTLSLSAASTESAWGVVRDVLPAPLVELLLPRSNRWEAPLQTDPSPPPIAIPDSSDFNVRNWTYGGKSYDDFRAEHLRESDIGPRRVAGSNGWVIAGRLTGHGGALLASDMHLGHQLPNIWYRARMTWPEAGGSRSVVGVTLPGTPALIAGSNGEVAWGFTTSGGDWGDLVVVEVDSLDSHRYRTPDGWRTFEDIAEIIEVAHSKPDTLHIRQTIWGPLWDEDVEGRPLAFRFVAHDVEAVNFELMNLESAANVDEVAALAGSFGVPGLDLFYADREGRVAWSLVGRLPRRVGFDGRMPVSWADGSCYWDGYLSPAEQPRWVDPPEGRVWMANNRVAAGKDLALIGDSGYALGARARQVRDALRAMEHPTEAEMLALQLDDRALFYGEWRTLALEALERPGAATDSLRAEYLRIVRDEWPGRAVPDAAAYRLVREFAFQCVQGVYDFLTKPCEARAPQFDSKWLSYRFAVAWELIHARPPHLLAPWYENWDDFPLQAMDRVLKNAAWNGRRLEDFTRAERVTVRVEHPLVQAVPQLEHWLAAPRQHLPGDSLLPRVQHARWGASERMVVSPGREEQGVFHMPGGQSGHPLSRFFLAGHDAWAEGKPLPLLPGAVRYNLLLLPK